MMTLQNQNYITNLLKKFACLLLSLTIFFLLFLPQNSYAFDESEIQGKTIEQLETEGWETQNVSTLKSSLKCGLWSILISTVWRGWGHKCADDDNSHIKFLILEATSLAMITSAILISTFSQDDKRLSPVWKALFHMGTSLFVSSYLFDVIGSFKGSETELPINHLNPKGFGTEFYMRWSPSSSLNVALQLDLIYRSKYFWVSPSAYIDIVEFSNWSTKLDLGVAVWTSENYPATYLAIANQTKFDHFVDDKYYTITTIPYLEFSLDLGSLFPHLENIHFVNRLGFGFDFFHFKNSPSAKYFADHSTILLLESELSANLFKDLNLRFAYKQRPDLLLGPISSPTKWFNTIPLPGIGIFCVDLNFKLQKNLFARLQLNFGTTADFWISLIKYF